MIHLLFTGGTISMRRDERLGGNVPAHSGAELVALAPELPTLATFRIEDWGRFPACHMGPEKLWELRSRVAALMSGTMPPAGIVITHGTDTIEETAYLLARTLPREVPVVITGAMRTASDDGWDGPRNLTDAVRVAVAPASRGRGTMVAFAGRIFDGLTVAKIEATALEAFDAPHHGAIGAVRDGAVEYAGPAAPAARRSRIGWSAPTARVPIIPMVIGDKGELLDAARPLSDGVVLAAFGSGNLPPGALPAIRRWLAEGKPVVLGTRCPRGEVTPVYAFEGGGAGLVKEGVIPAGARTLSQARLELALALSAGIPYGAANAVAS